MKPLALLLLLPLALAACAPTHPPLMEASGPYRGLNKSHWTPGPDDLRGPRQALAPVDSPSLHAPEPGV